MGNTSSTHSGSNSRTPRTEIERPPPSLLEPVHKWLNPTGQDVQIAAHILMGLRLQATPGHLPPELALSILAHADYRPRITSSRAGRLDYHPWGGRPWYLTTPMLPRDFHRARSITLQVCSEERHLINPTHLPVSGADNNDADRADEDHRHYTWFEMCILRPLRRRSPSPPPESGYVLRGCVLHKVPQPGRQMPPRYRGRGEADEDFRAGVPWLMVNHNGRETWVIHHHNSQIISDGRSGELSGERVNRTPTRSTTPLRRCETYRLDWPADSNPDTEDPQAYVDGEGFLSALMPGDKIAFRAAVEDPASGIAVKEAVMEIVYDVSI